MLEVLVFCRIIVLALSKQVAVWVLFSAVMVTAASVYSFYKRKKKIDCTSKLSHENRSTYFKGRKKGCFIKEIGKDWLYLYTFGSDLGDNVPILFFLSLRGSFSRQLSYSLIFILFYSLQWFLSSIYKKPGYLIFRKKGKPSLTSTLWPL